VFAPSPGLRATQRPIHRAGKAPNEPWPDSGGHRVTTRRREATPEHLTKRYELPRKRVKWAESMDLGPLVGNRRVITLELEIGR
jgi:hypothetical protein